MQLPKDNWSITVSSYHTDGNYVTGTDGTTALSIIDGNAATYWHSNYANGEDTGESTRGLIGIPQWFIVDLGSVQTFDAVGYTPRPNNQNGTCRQYEVYVSETAFDADLAAICTSADVRTKVSSMTNPTLSGTLTINGQTTKRHILTNGTPMTGRYVMFVFKNTGTNFASCGEFDILNKKHYLAVSHDGWSISASSDCEDTAPSGPIACAIDGNTDTYWHSNWKSEMTENDHGFNNNTVPHWFVVNLGSVQDFDAIAYTPRQYSGDDINGTIYKYKVYVQETAFDSDLMTWATSVETKNKVAAMTNPTLEGCFTIPANGSRERRVAVKADGSKMRGQYILFVAEDTQNANSNKHATCAEFDILNEVEPFIPEKGKAYTMKAKDSGLYLNLTKNSSQAVLSAEATPVFFSAEAGGTFRLAITPETYTASRFLNTSNWNATVSSDGKCYWTFEPVEADGSSCYQLSQTDFVNATGKYLGNNAHSEESKVLFVNAPESEAVDWVIEEYTGDLGKRYYTINSYNRGGSLTSVLPGTPALHITATTGSFWMLESQAGGGVKLYNMRHNKYFDFDSKKLTDNGSVFYLLQHEKQEEVDGYALSKTAAITSSSCIDANNNGNPGVGNWSPSASDWQGTTWMVRETNISDIAQLYTPYLDGLTAGENGIGYRTADVEAAKTEIANFGNGSAEWSTVAEKLNALEANAIWPVYSIENCNPSYGAGKTIIDDANGGQPHFKTANTIDNRMLWVIRRNQQDMTTGEYAMTNLHTDLPLRNVAQINVTETSDETQVEGQFLMKLGNDVQHAQNDNSVITTWNNTTTANSASAWKFNYIGTTADLAANAEIYAKGRALRDGITAAENYAGRIGTNLGQYGDMDRSAYNSEVAAIRTQKLDGKTPGTYVDATADIERLATLTSLPINKPKHGQLLRIRSARNNYTDYYLGSKNAENTGKSNDRAEFVSGTDGDNELATIFYLTDNDKLVNLATGYRLNIKDNFLSYNNIVEGAAFDFAAATTGAVGKYNIKFGSRSLYTQNNGETSVFTDAADWGADGAPAQEGYVFTLEEVSRIPASISAAGYATLYAPVSLTVPNEVTAYIAEVNEAQTLATLTPVSEIPAGTGVVLEGSEGPCYFTVSNAEPTKLGLLEGNAATTEYDQNSIYILAMPVNHKVGFYKMTSATNRTVKGGKAYLPAATTQGAPAYLFSFGEQTGIGTIEGLTGGKQEIYTLDGRRVAHPSKGIYIVGGKKVIIR